MPNLRLQRHGSCFFYFLLFSIGHGGFGGLSAQGFLLAVKTLQEGMLHTLGLITGHGVQCDGMNTAEDAVLDVGVVPHQAAQQDLDLLPLGAAATVIADGAGLGKAAGALDEFQVIVAPPGDNVVLAITSLK